MAKTSDHHAARSDENWVLLIVIAAAILIALLLVGGWMFNRQQAIQQQLRQQSEVYRSATRPVRNVSLPSDVSQAQYIEQKLINHPAVTPMEGFRQPGVQSTGNAIVDAIDQAQAKGR